MMSCEVVRDLLPLYADGLTSEESTRLIRAHTAQCSECSRMLEEMCAPMEPPVSEAVMSCVTAVRKQRRRNFRRILLAYVLSVLCCIAGWFLYMEAHFYTEESVIIAVDGEKILSEVPELALTEGEVALALQLWEAEPVRNLIGKNANEEIAAEKLHWLPWDTASVCVISNNVTVEYRQNGKQVFLTILGGTDPERASAIRKTVGNSRTVKEAPSKVVYEMEYVFALEKTWYQKYVTRRNWFSFLQMK